MDNDVINRSISQGLFSTAVNSLKKNLKFNELFFCVLFNYTGRGSPVIDIIIIKLQIWLKRRNKYQENKISYQ